VLRKFIPKDDVQQENYNGKRIEVSVTSSFASASQFLRSTCSLSADRFDTNFQLNQVEKQSSSKTVDATFDSTAFYVSAESFRSRPQRSTAGSVQCHPPWCRLQSKSTRDTGSNHHEANENSEYGFAILLSLAGVAGSMQTVNGQAKAIPRSLSHAPIKVVVIHLRSMSRRASL